jgi:hypothetical protein
MVPGVRIVHAVGGCVTTISARCALQKAVRRSQSSNPCYGHQGTSAALRRRIAPPTNASYLSARYAVLNFRKPPWSWPVRTAVRTALGAHSARSRIVHAKPRVMQHTLRLRGKLHCWLQKNERSSRQVFAGSADMVHLGCDK